MVQAIRRRGPENALCSSPVTTLRWGENVQAPVSRVLSEANRDPGPAPGKLLVRKGQRFGEWAGQLHAPPGIRPEHR